MVESTFAREVVYCGKYEGDGSGGNGEAAPGREVNGADGAVRDDFASEEKELPLLKAQPPYETHPSRTIPGPNDFKERQAPDNPASAEHLLILKRSNEKCGQFVTRGRSW
jgi:hypothetical protein